MIKRKKKEGKKKKQVNIDFGLYSMLKVISSEAAEDSEESK